jgi:DNA-binding transcriptional ArsR family regulator
MLKRLFSSGVRADVLSLLLESPEEKFYVREVAKLLRKNPSAVKRELDNLEKMGILRSQKVANLRYFQANKESPLFSELQGLITKSLGLAGNLKAVLRAHGVEAAFIWGPYAEGRDVKTVNLFVIGGRELDAAELRRLASRFGYRLRLKQVSREDFSRRRSRRDAQLAQVLRAKRINLLGRV